ncbi:MAG: hypothetical protein HYR79_12340 [Nitrospirae bacterium]|nr:hypothetical protein [Nitrospirota bacterium]
MNSSKSKKSNPIHPRGMTKLIFQVFFQVAFGLTLFSHAALAEIEITLNNSFIEKYKDRATIDVTYTVDKAHKRPNPGSKDGDIHIAGRAPEVELATVSEIMNAASQKDAVDRIHEIEGTDQTAKIRGAWRLWCEHGGSSSQIQGQTLAPFTTTNPDHVFEIHPVVQVDNISTLDSLIPIDGYDPKDAHDAFTSYENLKSQIKPGRKTTTIVTSMGGYNYVEFIMEINGDQRVIDDGRMVMASVHDTEGELLVRNKRMVFLKDTPPEKMVKALKKGDRLHVLGIPRIDLALVSWRSSHSQSKPETLKWNLPYEIIVVGVYDRPSTE